MAGRRGSTCDAYSKREYPARVRLTVTKRRLIYVLSKGAVRVVVHRPATVDELELSARNELPRESSGRVVLLRPPHLEERDLAVDEAARWVARKRVDDGRDDRLDGSALDLVVEAAVEVSDSLEPAYVYK